MFVIEVILRIWMFIHHAEQYYRRVELGLVFIHFAYCICQWLYFLYFLRPWHEQTVIAKFGIINTACCSNFFFRRHWGLLRWLFSAKQTIIADYFHVSIQNTFLYFAIDVFVQPYPERVTEVGLVRIRKRKKASLES